MKRFVWTLGIVLTGAVICVAQPPGGPRSGGPGGPGGQGGPGGGPGGGFQPPPNPVIEALDVNHDHVISAEELQNAPASLLTLDTNKDGKLTEDEFRPKFPGGPGGPGGQPGMRQNGNGNANRGNGQRNQGGGRNQGPQSGGQQGGGPGGRGPGGPDGGPPGGPDPARMVDHAMEFDLDKDGKLSREELTKFAEDFAKHHGPPGGPGGPGGGPDGGPPGGPGGGSGSTPERPRRPE